MANESADQLIQAAGAVLWRRNSQLQIEIAIIHRPKYDDWSLPKGKLEQGECHIAAAYREVLEETGFESVFGPEIGTVVYQLEGAAKEVRYWSAIAGTEISKPQIDEVDKIDWLIPKIAKERLTNKDDRRILEFFLKFGVDTFSLILLRHAKALKRSEWNGDDGDLPLEHRGQLQAKNLLPIYFPYKVREIHTSDAHRCGETVDPIAKSLGINPIYAADISEYGFEKDRQAALDYVQDLMERGIPAIVCSHNPVIPKIVKKLIGKKYFKSMNRELEPAQAIILHCRDGEVIACDWINEPTVGSSI